MRRAHSAIIDIPSASRVVEEQADGSGRAAILGHLEFKLLSPGGRDAVLAHLASRVRHLPACLDPTLEQELLEHRIERAFFDAQLFTREEVNPLGNGVSVKRLGVQHAKDQEDEGSWRNASACRHRMTMPIARRWRSVKRRGRVAPRKTGAASGV